MMLIFDIDGTLDTRKNHIYFPIPTLLSRCLDIGVDVTFATNRPLWWVAETILKRLLKSRKNSRSIGGKLFVACEQGATIHMINGYSGGKVLYKTLQHTPLLQKQELEACVDRAIRDSEVFGQRRCSTRSSVCLELRSPYNGDPSAWLPVNLRRKARIARTRSTISFVPTGAGKDAAIAQLVKSNRGLDSTSTLAFGDDGDLFAAEVPTIDVDRLRRRTFEKKGLPSIGITNTDLAERVGCPQLARDEHYCNALMQGGGIATAAVMDALLNRWMSKANWNPKCSSTSISGSGTCGPPARHRLVGS